MIQYEHLLARPYLPGVRDCFGHARQIYIDSFDITVTNYARPLGWSADGEDLIRNLHDREGFDMIVDWKAKDLRPADVLCLAIGERNPNHIAVYVGDNKVTHHLLGRLSNEETYRDFWRNSTCFILRHPDVPDLRPVLENKDLGSLLRERHSL